MTPEVETFLARGGRIRRFEQGASSNPIVLLDWVRGQGLDAAYLGNSRIRIGRQTMDLAALYDRVNAMRKEQGLEPFSMSRSKSKAHFCFAASPAKRKEFA